MIMVQTSYRESASPSERERDIYNWMTENVKKGDYQLIGSMLESGKKTALSRRDLLHNWIDYINFKNEEDATAFKLRFGL